MMWSNLFLAALVFTASVIVDAQTPTPTESPIPGGVETPTALAPSGVNVTLAPASGVNVTLAPASAPTTATGTSAQVVIRLISTDTAPVGFAGNTFEIACAAFYNDLLPEFATNVSCIISSQVRQLYHSRATQAIPHDVTTTVMATLNPSVDVIDFANALVTSVNNNTETFVLRLRTLSDANPTSRLFYSTLSDVMAFDPLFVAPVAPPAGSPLAPPAGRPVAPPSGSPPSTSSSKDTHGFSNMFPSLLIMVSPLMSLYFFMV